MPAITLPVTGPYTAKDQRKANRATKFIGHGSPSSSTAVYARAFSAHGLTNCGRYSASDVVFISAEGRRPGRIDPDAAELMLAAHASVTFITDTAADRARPYNLGERQVAYILARLHYIEQGDSGIWRPRP